MSCACDGAHPAHDPARDAAYDVAHDPARNAAHDPARDAAHDPTRLASALGPLIQLEARLATQPLATDERRSAEGWQRRFVADHARADEAAELYRQLGFEVCLDPVSAADFSDDCADCQLVALLRFRVVYTRR